MAWHAFDEGDLSVRTRHPKADLAAAESFKTGSPGLARDSLSESPAG